MMSFLSTVEIEQWRAVLVRALDATITARTAAMRASVDDVLRSSVQVIASRKLLDSQSRNPDATATRACGAYILREEIL